jgi:hypothetical protein
VWSPRYRGEAEGHPKSLINRSVGGRLIVDSLPSEEATESVLGVRKRDIAEGM